MFKVITQNISRKRLNSRTAGSYSDLISLRKDSTTAEGLAHSLAGAVCPAAASVTVPPEVSFATAGFHAQDPQSDQHVLQASDKHVFAAVITQQKVSRGAHYLRQHIYMELLAHMKKQCGNMQSALKGALDSLNRDFGNLNPANHHILERIELAVAFLDFKTSELFIASNGCCRCIVGKKAKMGGGVQIVADIGNKAPKDLSDTSYPSGITIPVSRGSVDTIILGSTGFWQEVEPLKAALRIECYFQSAPKANQSSVAAHLINYSLHCVNDRLRDHKDPRMSSLRSVNNLVSLPLGDKTQYKWGKRQPVRRRRGDVHKDLTVVALHLHWEGRQTSLEGSSKKTRQTLKTMSREAKHYSHWDLVRLHFLDFPRRLKGLEAKLQQIDIVPAHLTSEHSSNLDQSTRQKLQITGVPLERQ